MPATTLSNGTLHVPKDCRFTYRKERGLVHVHAVHKPTGLTVRARGGDADEAHARALEGLFSGAKKLGVVLDEQR